ncbi:unknown [Clostridium sp. CAG:768]|nr:unknown [Clostridium sp. CAG:768]
MKIKLLTLILCIIMLNSSVLAQENKVFAENQKPNCGCSKQTKCIDLMTSMYNERATLYNVLNLSNDQQKCKDVIDKKRYEELGVQFRQYEQEKYVLDNMCKHNASEQAIKKQEKVVKNIEKCMKEIGEKYDKEFKSILNSEQKAKYNSVRKMEKKEIKYCLKNKAFYKRDPKLRPFGEKMYYGEQNNVLCPVHKKWHLFGYKHKLEETQIK